MSAQSERAQVRVLPNTQEVVYESIRVARQLHAKPLWIDNVYEAINLYSQKQPTPNICSVKKSSSNKF